MSVIALAMAALLTPGTAPPPVLVSGRDRPISPVDSVHSSPLPPQSIAQNHAPGTLFFAAGDHLFRISPEGTHRQSLPLLSDQPPAPYDALAWSADGHYLAMVRNYREIYVWSTRQPEAVPVFVSACPLPPDLDLAWTTPNPTLLIQEVCDAPATTSTEQQAVYLADPNTPNSAQPLATLPDNLSSELFISPDGSEVAFVWANPLGESHIYRLALGSSTPEQVTSKPGIYGAAGSPLAWSPDGQRLAFFAGNYPQQKLYVINRDGSNLRLLTPDPNHQIYRSDLFWAPDGQSIIFYQPANPPYGNEEFLRQVNLVTGELKTLSRSGFYEGVQWSPNRQQIAFAMGRFSAQRIFLLDLTTNQFIPLSNSFTEVGQIQWSPDGTRLAFTAEPPGQSSGNQVLFSVRADGSDLRSLTSPDEYIYPFVWAPQ